MLLTLELYRESKVSLGRVAELCQTSVEEFMVFAGRHEVPMHYASRIWKKIAALLIAWARDRHLGFLAAHYSCSIPGAAS